MFSLPSSTYLFFPLCHALLSFLPLPVRLSVTLFTAKVGRPFYSVSLHIDRVSEVLVIPILQTGTELQGCFRYCRKCKSPTHAAGGAVTFKGF